MSTNALRASIEILTSPGVTFDIVKSKKRWWLVPFALVTTSIVALFMYYFANVDFPWLKETMLDQMAAQQTMNEDELQAAGDFLSKTSLLWSTTIGGALSLVFINAILALYLNITTKFSGKDEYSYGNWFAFSWWTSMPHVVTIMLSMLLVTLSVDGMLAMEDLSVTTLNSLLFSVDAVNPWFNFLNTVDVFMFWSITLIAIGLKSWLGIETQKAATIAAAPFAVLFGIWALIIVFTA